MNRYENNNVISSTSTVRRLSSTRYPDIPVTIDDVYIITQYGDRLDNLAYQYYGDSTLWWILSIANPNLPNDSLYPTLGYQLRIPIFITEILNDFNNLNS